MTHVARWLRKGFAGKARKPLFDQKVTERGATTGISGNSKIAEA
jgi:hypothetical protein